MLVMGPSRSRLANVPVLLLMICATSAYAKLGNNIVNECGWCPITVLTPPCTFPHPSVTPRFDRLHRCSQGSTRHRLWLGKSAFKTSFPPDIMVWLASPHTKPWQLEGHLQLLLLVS